MKRRPGTGCWAFGLLLGVLATSSAAAGEQGRYTFELFQTAHTDARLPLELQGAGDGVTRAPSPLSVDHRLAIEWLARESPGLSGYRITARLDGGALAGLTAQWNVDAGSGFTGADASLRRYHLDLPLAIDDTLHVRASIEALREHGGAVVLAVKDVHPWDGLSRRLPLLVHSGRWSADGVPCGKVLAAAGQVALLAPVARVLRPEANGASAARDGQALTVRATGTVARGPPSLS